MRALEHDNRPSYMVLGLVLAAGAVALLHNNQNVRALASHKPVPGQERVINYEGNDAVVTYFQDGTRDLTELDKNGKVIRIFREKCKHIFLDGKFLQIDEISPNTLPTSSTQEAELAMRITEKSPICDDGYVIPKDFSGNEARIDTYE
jgi:hypothetical protein